MDYTNIVNFLGIGVVGVIVSLAVNFIKNKFGVSSGKTKLITLGLCIAGGTAFYFLSKMAIWETIVGVLLTATAFWAFILKTDA